MKIEKRFIPVPSAPEELKVRIEATEFLPETEDETRLFEVFRRSREIEEPEHQDTKTHRYRPAMISEPPSNGRVIFPFTDDQGNQVLRGLTLQAMAIMLRRTFHNPQQPFEQFFAATGESISACWRERLSRGTALFFLSVDRRRELVITSEIEEITADCMEGVLSSLESASVSEGECTISVIEDKSRSNYIEIKAPEGVWAFQTARFPVGRKPSPRRQREIEKLFVEVSTADQSAIAIIRYATYLAEPNFVSHDANGRSD